MILCNLAKLGTLKGGICNAVASYHVGGERGVKDERHFDALSIQPPASKSIRFLASTISAFKRSECSDDVV